MKIKTVNLSVLTYLLLVLVVPNSGLAANRNQQHTASKYFPPLTKYTNNYTIGYGSLMETKSRERTIPNAKVVHPIEVCGFKRSWSYRPSGIYGKLYKVTALGVSPAKKTSCFNAVFYPVSAAQLYKEDTRELTYRRIRVPRNQLKSYTNHLPKGGYWIYALRDKQGKKPDHTYPLIQSYIDIFITGCLELEKKYKLPHFAEHCITSTHGWNTAYWINDREYPRRPFKVQPNATTIDLLLLKNFKNYPSIKIAS